MNYTLFAILLFLTQSIFAQSTLPIIKATSKRVAINDGGYLDKNAWALSPKIRPDIFTADRTRKTKWVTFYTDIDSIKVKVKPGTKYNFIVLLNGKDSCYTQIASAIPSKSTHQRRAITHDTIPFTLTAFNAIQVKTIINDTDTLNLHFDVGSFDFHLTKDAILKKTKLLSNQPDVLAGKATPNYTNLTKIFKLQMGNSVWTNPEVTATGLTSHDMDGRFGWNLFEGKQVEIDYDHNRLLIHSELPKALKGYVKSKLEFIHSFVCMKGAFSIENKKYTGTFLIDTGSDQAIILDSTWASKQNFSQNLKLIKSSVIRDPRGVKYETKLMLFPLLKLNTFELTNIPTLVLGSKNPVGFEVNYVGNDLLKRFNMVFDFERDYIYLKPNKLMNLKFRENT
ncbi:hypothetical protein GO755_28865 [Spirosoma sp. HMF4905]|uniref:Peptidase A2 domain-containing protein n=1 Tax=Spirosoma arboris TaxID=2682092 RepID=A0A7K1SJU8_9BACT|nr:hypothetical protein [Spirosoma arboris]MVM34080.1 hypothetical protein [Spirosoma arboris]